MMAMKSQQGRPAPLRRVESAPTQALAQVVAERQPEAPRAVRQADSMHPGMMPQHQSAQVPSGTCLCLNLGVTVAPWVAAWRHGDGLCIRRRGLLRAGPGRPGASRRRRSEGSYRRLEKQFGNDRAVAKKRLESGWGRTDAGGCG